MRQTFNAPLRFATNAEAALALSADEARQCRANGTEAGNALRCEVPLNIGLFFDGTNNNADRDEPDRGHSNIVRLYNTHPSMDSTKAELRRPGHYSIYVPGAGTPFEANNEIKESSEGKSTGKGGQARILFGVIEIFNAIYKAFQQGQPLYTKQQVAAKLKDFVNQVEQATSTDPERPRPTRNSWLKELNEEMGKKISAARENAPKPVIPDVFISVFGFSRGAAQAAAFCHWLNAALPGGKIAGMRVRIGFLGLFDCVASIGLADSARRAVGIGFADGHFDWAGEIRKTLPPLVQRVVHCIAAHEQRLNFPCTRIKANCDNREYLYPGMHSDVGGGYGLLTQGRSENDGELLSQIPLMHMYKEARTAGVALLAPFYFADTQKKDFDLGKTLPAAYNAYMEVAQENYRAQYQSELADCRDHTQLVRLHMQLYYSYRRNHLFEPGTVDNKLFRLYGIEPNAQDQENLLSYNALFTGDVSLLQARAKEREKCQRYAQPYNPAAMYAEWRKSEEGSKVKCNMVLGTMLKKEGLPLHYTDDQNRAAGAIIMQSSDREWLDWVTVLFSRNSPTIGMAHWMLLGKYAHDSLAGFCLAGYATLEEQSDKLFEIVEKHDKGETLNLHEKEVYARYAERKETNADLGKVFKKRNDAKNNFESVKYTNRLEEILAEEEYKKEGIFTPQQNNVISDSGVFPVLKDSDAPQLFAGLKEKIAITLLTEGRREGGGYLLPRAVFD